MALQIKFYADRSSTPFYTKALTNDQEFLLPEVTMEEFEVEIVGTTRVNSIQVATTMEELG